MFDFTASLQELMPEEVPVVVEEDEAEGYDESVIETVEAETSMQSAMIMEAHALHIFESLESLQARVETLAGEDGLTLGEATMWKETLQNLVPALNMGDLVSLQSFEGEAADRKGATEDSMQAVGERMGAIWRAFVNGVLRAMASIADFLSKLFSSVPKLKAKLAATKKAVSAAKFEGKDKVKLSGYSRLGMDGKMDAGTVATGLSNIEKYLTALYNFKNLAVKVYEVSTTSMAKMMGASSEDVFNAIGQELTTVLTDAEENKAFEAAANLKFPGDRKYDPDSMTLRAAKAPETETMEVEPWNASDCNKVIDEAIKLLDMVDKGKDYAAEIDKARKTAMENVTKLVDAMDKGKLGKWVTKTKVTSYSKGVRKNFTNMYSSGANFGYSSARAALAAVNTMIGGKAAAPEGEPAKAE